MYELGLLLGALAPLTGRYMLKLSLIAGVFMILNVIYDVIFALPLLAFRGVSIAMRATHSPNAEGVVDVLLGMPLALVWPVVYTIVATLAGRRTVK